MFSFKAWMVLCGCCLLYKCLCEVKNREKIIKSRITDNSNSIIRIGKFIGYFLADQQSPFYQTPAFTNVLQYVQNHPQQCQLKEKQTRNGLRLLLVFDGIKNVEKVLRVLEPLELKN